MLWSEVDHCQDVLSGQLSVCPVSLDYIYCCPRLFPAPSDTLVLLLSAVADIARFQVPPDPPEDWLLHKSPHRILLRNLQVYSFCDEYRAYRQRTRFGAFRIRFANAAAATRFKQLFNPIPAPSVEDPSEDRGEEEDSPSEE